MLDYICSRRPMRICLLPLTATLTPELQIKTSEREDYAPLHDSTLRGDFSVLVEKLINNHNSNKFNEQDIYCNL